MRKNLILFLSAVILLGVCSNMTAAPKVRVIVTSDGEVDDQCSLVRFLLYANEFDVEGIIKTSSQYHAQDHDWPGDYWEQPYLDAYAQVYPNLSAHDPAYPTPEYLQSVTKLGNVETEGEMTEVTPGSQLIVDVLLDESDNQPVWLQAWGGINTIARALKTIEEDYPEKMAYVAGKIRFFFIWEQDDTYQSYIRPNWAQPYNILTIISDQFITFGYWWEDWDLPDEMAHYFSASWMNENLLENHGPLLESYNAQSSGAFRSEGDSPSFIHEIPTGLRNLESPDWGGWGGRYVLIRENTWLDPVPEDGYEYPSGRWYTSTAWGRESLRNNSATDEELLEYFKPIWRWIDVIQNDFAARADWCVKSYEEANHPPVVTLANALNITAGPGDNVQLSAQGSYDPDGDQLTYTWWQYEEAGSYTGAIDIQDAGNQDAYFTVPADAGTGETIHVICEATDLGTPPLTRYQRVIVTVGPFTPVPVTGVSVSPTTATLDIGATTQLIATVEPSDATNKNVSWSSSNTSVATVNSSGLVTGVAEGFATITVTTADGGFTATCDVTVEDVVVPVTGVSVSPVTVSVGIGASTQLTATVEPSNADNQNVSWSSSNTAVATVNSSGLVTGVAEGSATITVTTEDGGFTATCDVTVSDIIITTITIQENETGFISVDGSIDNNNAGFTGDGFANTDNANGNGITWEICAAASGTYTLEWRFANGASANRTAQVEVDGAVAVSNVDFPSTGSWTSWDNTSSVDVTLSSGTRQIRLEATNSSGLANIDYINITGNNPQAGECSGVIPVTGVSVSPTTASVDVGASTQLTATVEPSNATNQNVSWSSSNTSVATVSSSGLVTGVAEGSATITVTTEDGGFTATCNVTVSVVVVPVTGVSVSPTTASVGIGATTQLTATVSPSNATNKNVSWSSSNTSVATVSSSGLVTGVAEGSATITVTTEDGGFTATCNVTVEVVVVPVTGVSVSPTTASVVVGGTTQLTATVAPANATNKNVSWSSSNTAVATVNSSGLVTGVASGSTTITVTTEDGGYTAMCDVTVSNITTITIQENETGVVSYDGIITTGFAGYTGSGSIDTDNAVGNGITWEICAPSSGTYTLQWRYSNGDSKDRPGQLLVDGTVVVSNVSLPPTGGWTSWTMSSSVNVTLAAGTRLIRLEGTTSSALGLTDYITVTGDNPQPGSCTGTIPVTGVSVSPATASVNVGATTQLTATVEPSNATNQNVTWSSSNTAIVTVNSSGLVTGVADGSATITVTTEDGGFTDDCTVTVSTVVVPVTGVSVSPATASITIGATTQLTATIEPSNATNQNVTWSSSNTAIATVNSSGLVTGVAEGSATITVTTEDGDFTDDCSVSVTQGSIETITIQENETGVDSFDGIVTSNFSGYTGDGCIDTDNAVGNGITWEICTPSSGTYTLQWRYSNGDSKDRPGRLLVDGTVVESNVSLPPTGGWTSWTMSSTVNVTLAAGTRLIRLEGTTSSALGLTDYITVTGINPQPGSCTGTIPVTGVSVSPTSVSVGIGATTQLTATVEPSNATNKNVSWSSSNTAVATVSSSGLVTGVAEGSATITVTTEDGGFTATCDVTVSDIVITTILIQENETGVVSYDGDIDSDHSGHTGDGYINTDNENGNGITWEMCAAASGTYTLEWRFANGASANRTAQVEVDGAVAVSNVDFPSTGAWNSWSTSSSVDVTLSGGTRQIRLEATNSSGLANIDYISITGNNPQAGACGLAKDQPLAAEQVIIPSEFKLYPAYPNPFNPDTKITFSIPASTYINISVFDVSGRMIRTLIDENKNAGEYSVTWDASGLPSGVYFIKLMSANFSATTKCLLMK